MNKLLLIEFAIALIILIILGTGFFHQGIIAILILATTALDRISTVKQFQIINNSTPLIARFRTKEQCKSVSVYRQTKGI